MNDLLLSLVSAPAGSSNCGCAPPAGSANTSLLATAEYRKGKAPEPKVGEIVHVYGPEGVSYVRARVFEASPDAIVVVSEKRRATLTRAQWNQRVRAEDLRDFALIPAFLRPAEPPALPASVRPPPSMGEKALRWGATVGVVALGGAVSALYLAPELGAKRGAITGVSTLAGGLLGGLVAHKVSANAELGARQNAVRWGVIAGGAAGGLGTGMALGAREGRTAQGAALGFASLLGTAGLKMALDRSPMR